MDLKDYAALWGAGLSTALALVKGWELWRDRFQVEADYNFRSSISDGNDVIIRNLGSRPVTVKFWEVLYRGGPPWARKWERITSADMDDGDFSVEPHRSATLNFSGIDYFAWGHDWMAGKKIFIRLYVGECQIFCVPGGEAAYAAGLMNRSA